MAVDRHELERSKWLLAHAGNNKVMLKRAHTLEARARERDRAEAGAAHTSHHEARMASGLGQRLARCRTLKGKALFLGAVAVGTVAAAFAVGPAWLIGTALYRVADWQMPKIGPLKSWWFYLLAGCLAPIGYLVSVIAQLESFGSFYWYAQILLGIAYAGYLVRAWGWPAVTVRESVKAPKMPAPAGAKAQTPAVPTVPRPAAAKRTAAKPANETASPVPSAVPGVPSVPRPRVPEPPAPFTPPEIDEAEISTYLDVDEEPPAFDEDAPIYDPEPAETAKEA